MAVDPTARLWLEPVWIYSDVVSTLSFFTDVQSFQDGQEQRWALRDEPRRQLEFSHRAKDDAFRRIQRNLRAFHQDDFTVPDRSRAVEVSGTYDASATTITAVEARPWMVAGESVAVVEGTRIEARTIASVSGAVLTLVETNTTAWGDGALVLPLISGRFSESLTANQVVPGHTDLRITFDAKPEFEPVLAATSAPKTLDGFELWDTRPMPFDPIGVVFDSNVTRIDYGVGLWSERKPIAYTGAQEQLSWRFGTRGAHQSFEDLFRRMKGRRGEFYMPTWTEDFRVLGTAAQGANTIDVIGDVDVGFASSLIWKGIAVEYTDGTIEAHKIQSIASLGDNATITINGTWARAVSQSAVSRVMWCPRWRFAADSLQTLWRVADYPLVRAEFQTLRDQA